MRHSSFCKVADRMRALLRQRLCARLARMQMVHRICPNGGHNFASRGPKIEWLFCPIYQGKVIDRCLETTTVRRVIKEAAQRCDLHPEQVASFSGHSMRVGAAQDLLKRGFDTAAIMRAGGWKSVNVLARYLEKAEHNVWA